MEIHIRIKVDFKEIVKSIFETIKNYSEGMITILKHKEIWYGLFFSFLIHFTLLTVIFEEPPVVEEIKGELIMVDVLDETYRTSAIDKISKQKLYTTVLPTNNIKELQNIRSDISSREEKAVYTSIAGYQSKKRKGYSKLLSDIEVLTTNIKENVKDTIVISKNDILAFDPMFFKTLRNLRDKMDRLSIEIVRMQFFIVISKSGEVLSIQKLRGSQYISWDNLIEEAIKKSAFSTSKQNKLRRGIFEILIYREGEYTIKLNGGTLRTGELSLYLELFYFHHFLC